MEKRYSSVLIVLWSSRVTSLKGSYKNRETLLILRFCTRSADRDDSLQNHTNHPCQNIIWFSHERSHKAIIQSLEFWKSYRSRQIPLVYIFIKLTGVMQSLKNLASLIQPFHHWNVKKGGKNWFSSQTESATSNILWGSPQTSAVSTMQICNVVSLQLSLRHS